MKYNVDTVRESGWYNKKEWLAVRDYVRQRDKMTCVRCGVFGAKKYEVDHIIELTWENLDDWKIALNPDNLQLLCKSCHNKKTGEHKRGKGVSLW
jgi:5-methylcytosine-specific restriction protein A